MLFLTALLACAPQTTPGELPRTGEVLEAVNGKAVTQDMMNALLDTMPAEYRAQLEAEGKMAEVQEQLVTQDMLYQESIKRGLQNDRIRGGETGIFQSRKHTITQRANDTATQTKSGQYLSDKLRAAGLAIGTGHAHDR